MARQPTGYYLIAYDVRCPRRLRRVHRVLSKEGLAVQYSVFLCPAEIFGALWKELKTLIAPEDDLRAYPVSHLNALWLSGRSWNNDTQTTKPQRAKRLLRLFTG